MRYLGLNRGSFAKVVGGAALSVGMVASAGSVAYAQGGDEEAPKDSGTINRSEGSFSSTSNDGEHKTSIGGTIQGTVESLNLARGTIEVSTGGDTLVMHAVPNQLAQLSPGDNVSLDYDSYKGVLWVTSDLEGGDSEMSGKFAHHGTVSGAVTSMDKPKGLITIRGRSYHVHPSKLSGVVPGEFVSLQFAKVGDANWASSLDSNEGG